MSGELTFDEGASYGVGTVGVVAVGNAEILDSCRPSVRIVIIHVGGPRGQNEQLVLIRPMTPITASDDDPFVVPLILVVFSR